MRTTHGQPAFAVSRDGTRIAFERLGRGPALILVGGALSDRRGGNALAEALQDRFTVFTFDRRGRGDSTDTKPYAVDREIDDLAALIEQAGGSAFLSGTSSGGALALQAAAKLGPTKVTRLANDEAPYGQPDREFAETKQLVQSSPPVTRPPASSRRSACPLPRWSS